jgi:Undecaprenyl-phosphate glucose phosphotransferase
MTTDVSVHSVEHFPARRHANTQAFWAVAAVFAESVVIAAVTYMAFVAYNYAAYRAIPDHIVYLWAAVAMGVLYGGLGIADNQYDLLGEKWNEHNRSRGAAIVVLAFVLFLTIGFVGDELRGYSRGTFLVQLVCALVAQIVTRTILWQVVDQARIRGEWRQAGMVMLIMPGVYPATDMRARLATRNERILRSYDLGPAVRSSPHASDVEEQLAKIRAECRTLSIDAVLIVFDADNMAFVTRAVSALSELPVRIQLLPIGMMDFMRCSRIGSCGRVRVLELFCGPSSLRDRILKRGLDLVAASSLIVLLAPLLLIVACLVKLDSRGPALFRQTRHGFNNELIRVLKFRSMSTFDDTRGEFQQAVQGDARITRVGRIIRRTNIDELPQLINVLRGDMSMVGPRPHALAHNDMFANRVRKLWRRHNVKPGITGWAQVNGLRGETDTTEKMRKRVEYDLYYIDNWSFFFDLKIMIMTVLSKKSYENAW